MFTRLSYLTFQPPHESYYYTTNEKTEDKAFNNLPKATDLLSAQMLVRHANFCDPLAIHYTLLSLTIQKPVLWPLDSSHYIW